MDVRERAPSAISHPAVRRSEGELGIGRRRRGYTRRPTVGASCVRFVDDDVRKEWTTLGKSYKDLKDKVHDHMARQRLNAGLALRCAHGVCKLAGVLIGR